MTEAEKATDNERMARIKRDRMMRKMALCRCEWPVTKYRNGDGHHEDCPAHVPLSQHLGRTRDD